MPDCYWASTPLETELAFERRPWSGVSDPRLNQITDFAVRPLGLIRVIAGGHELWAWLRQSVDRRRWGQEGMTTRSKGTETGARLCSLAPWA